MSKPFFVYTIYIASTPEKVFKALTDTDVTAKFWFGNAVISDWKTGAPVEFRREGKLIVQGKSAGIRSAAAAVLHVPLDARTFLWGRATRARCHHLEKQKDQVKLTVTHDDFAEGSKVFDAISKGWPLVLSSLKSYLEANRVLYAPWYDKEPAAAS